MQLLLKVGTKSFSSVIIILAVTLMFVSGLLFLQAVSNAAVIKEFSSNGTNFVLHKNYIEAFNTNSSGAKYKIWQSETDIEKIDNAFIYDADKDGKDDLVLLVWTHQDYFANR